MGMVEERAWSAVQESLVQPCRRTAGPQGGITRNLTLHSTRCQQQSCVNPLSALALRTGTPSDDRAPSDAPCLVTAQITSTVNNSFPPDLITRKPTEKFRLEDETRAPVTSGSPAENR